MNYCAGIDVSLEASSVCVVNGEGKVASEPKDLIQWLRALKMDLARFGLEAGPLSQWLHAALRQAGFAVELLETRHVRNAFKNNAGQDRRQRRARHRGIDAPWLVPPGAMQDNRSAGETRAG